MTPLEELQAAHERLSGLRGMATGAPWEIVGERGVWDENPAETLIAGTGCQIGDWMADPDADLIVTLHRTIDAQLRLLSDAQFLVQQGFGQQSVLALARAINGGAE